MNLASTVLYGTGRLLLPCLVGSLLALEGLAQEETDSGSPATPVVSETPGSAWEQMIAALELGEWTQVKAGAETVQGAADSGPIQRATATLVLKALGFTQAKQGEMDPITTETLRALESRKAEAQRSVNALKSEERQLAKDLENLKKERDTIDKNRGGELGLAILDMLTSAGSSGGTDTAKHARAVTQGKLEAKDAEIRRVQEEMATVKKKASIANGDIGTINAQIAKVKQEGQDNWKVREGEFKGELLQWMGKLTEEGQLRAAAALANFYPNDTAVAQAAQKARNLALIRKEATEALAQVLPAVREQIDKKAFWTARQQLAGIPAALGDRMKEPEFARVVESELLIQQKRAESGINDFEQKVEAVRTAGQKNYRDGFAALGGLRESYPDWPETQELEVKRQIATWRVEQIEARVVGALRPIEEAAKGNAKEAWEQIRALKEATPEDERAEAVPLLEAGQDRVILIWSGAIVDQRDAQWRLFEQFLAAYGDGIDTGRDPLLTSKSGFKAEAEVVPQSEKRIKDHLAELSEMTERIHGTSVRAEVQALIQATGAKLASVEEVAGKIEERRKRLSRDATVGGGALAVSFLGTTAFCWWRRKQMLSGQ